MAQGQFSSLNQSLVGNQDFDATMAGDGYPAKTAKDSNWPVWRAGGRAKRPALLPRFGLSPQTPPSGITGSNMLQSITTAKGGGKGEGDGRPMKRKNRGAATRDSRSQTRGDPARRENSDGRRWSSAVRDTSDARGPGTGKPNTDLPAGRMRSEPTPTQQREMDREKARQRRKSRRLAKQEMKRMRAAVLEETTAEIAQATKARARGIDFDLDLSVLPQAKLDEWMHLRSQLRNSGLAGRKRGVAWFQKLIRELKIVPPPDVSEGPLAAFSVVSEDINGMFEEIDDFIAARQSTFKWKKSLRAYCPAVADAPIATSQRALGVTGEGALVDPVSQTLKSVAQSWSSDQFELLADTSQPKSVDRLVAQGQSRTSWLRHNKTGVSIGASPAVSGIKLLTQAEQDAGSGYQWPPRGASLSLPPI